MRDKPLQWIIETERFYLRELGVGDALDMYQMNGDPDVIRYVGGGSFGSEEAAAEFLKTYDPYSKHGMGRWACILKDSSKFTGWCGLVVLEETGEIDLGYRFYKKYWGRGYATETAKACLEYGFNKLKLQRITASAALENHQSIKVIEKLGMLFEENFTGHGERAARYAMDKMYFETNF